MNWLPVDIDGKLLYSERNDVQFAPSILGLNFLLDVGSVIIFTVLLPF